MNSGLKIRNVLGMIGLGALLWSGALSAEEMAGDVSSNPFDPVKLKKQSIGAWMRRPFHKVRTTWDDYFKVWPKPKQDHHATTLEILKSQPKFFLERKVELDVLWNKRGAFYRQFVAPFHRNTHVNFSCWAHGTELWDRNSRMDIFPFLYVDIEDGKLIRELDKYPPYTPLHIWADVITVCEGYPWLEISNVEPLNKEVPHTVSTLRDLELAFRLKNKKLWKLAVSRFDAALAKGLPLLTERKVYAAKGRCLKERRLFPEAREALIAGLKLYGHDRIQLVDALKQHPECVPALLDLIQVDLQLNRDKEAKDGAETALYIEPFNPVVHAELGLAKARLGNIRGGLSDINAGQRLASGSRLPEAHRNRAQVMVLQNDLAGAEKELTNAILLRTNEVQYHMELGDVYLAMKNPAKAQVQFENANRLAPNRPEPFHMLAVSFKAQGDIAAAAGKKEEAGKFYALALEKIKACHQADDQYAPAYGFHAELLRALGKNDEAMKVLEEGARAVPKDVSIQDFLYEQARAQGDWDAMERAAMAAVILEPKDASKHLRLGHVRAYRPTSPDIRGAESEYATSASLDPNNAEAWAHLTHMRRKLQMWQSGAVAGNKAVTLASDNVTAWTDLGICRTHLGAWTGAVDAAEQAFALKDTVASRTNLAVASLNRDQAGDADKALELAKRAAAEASVPAESANAQSALGAALARAGKAEEAVAALKAAGDSLAGDAWHSLWMAKALMQSGDFDQAVVFFAKAANLANTDNSGSKLLQRIATDAKKGLKDAKKAKRKKAIRSSVQKKEREIQEAVIKQETVQTETETEYELKKAVDSSELEEPKKKKDQAKANQKPIIEVEASPEPVKAKQDPEPEVEAR